MPDLTSLSIKSSLQPSTGYLMSSHLPTDISQVSYQDLSGLIKLKANKGDPNHGGGYSDVHVSCLTEGGKTIKVAVKILRLVNEQDRIDKVKTQLIRETTTWKSLRHRNVLEFLGLADTLGRHGCPALVSPYCDNGTVTTYLKEHSSNEIRFSMITGTAVGLKYLHDNNVIHGDLKPSNILVHDDGRPLLCDFGRSKILDTRGFTTRPVGAVRYQAPEIHEGNDLSLATDVYAFGITSYEMWTGVLPWEGMRDSPIVVAIMRDNQRPVCPDPAPPGTEPLWPLFEKCWDTEPEKRPCMKRVVQHLESVNIPSS